MDGLFNNLYEKFFMRDLLARIAPGIFMLFVIWQVIPHRSFFRHEDLEMPILSVLFIISISYFLGFGAQKLGEGLGILSSRYCIFLPINRKQERWFIQLKRRVFFDTNPHKRLNNSAIKQRDRLVYLKDGSGSFGIAVLLSALLLHSHFIISTCMVFFGLLMIWSHHTLWEEQAEYEIEVLARMGLINRNEHCETLYKYLRHDC